MKQDQNEASSSEIPSEPKDNSATQSEDEPRRSNAETLRQEIERLKRGRFPRSLNEFVELEEAAPGAAGELDK